MDFKKQIINWYFQHSRTLPWRASKDPYSVWLSEIILQQTRVEQGVEYFKRFITHFPDVCKLANASEDEVLKLWQGLGYYSRARNLHATAKVICKERGGCFPETSQELLKLKGIGPYTAAAISSICFNEINPAIDGNVYRVLSRIFDLALPIDSSAGKLAFKKLSQSLISSTNPGDYNQAVMEFGACVCLPKLPHCQTCIFQNNCLAYQKARVDQRPVKQNKIKVQKRFFTYFIPVFYRDGQCLSMLKKRQRQDIWKGLFEFPLYEGKKLLDEEEVFTYFQEIFPFSRIGQLKKIEKDLSHMLSHRRLQCRFYLVYFADFPVQSEWEDDIRPIDELIKFAVPKPIEKVVELIPKLL